jgi:transposase
MTEITQEQYEKIMDVSPVQRGNVRIDNLRFLNAIFYIAENGCKRRKLPEHFGPWHTVDMRFHRRADNDVRSRVLAALLSELSIKPDITALSLAGTGVKVHPDGMGSLKKTANNPSAKVAAAGTRRFI